MEREEFIALFLKYRQNRCNAEEAERLIRHINQGYDPRLVEQLMGSLPDRNATDDPLLQETLDRVFARVQATKQEIRLQPRNPRRVWGWWVAAVAAVLVAALSVLRYVDNEGNGEVSGLTVAISDIAPGGNRATLTLADGRTIALSEAHAGIVVAEVGITYQDGSAPVADLGAANVAGPEMLSLTTPKGGTYQVTLPDGSKVWLNAASTLTYPSRFDGNSRTVTLSGEGYFEVTKDERKPFRVMSEGQQVEVLGTAFNVSAYPDDSETKTTLVTGAVRLGGVGNGVKLAPGQQGILAGNEIRVEAVDVDTYTGWKNNEFVFNGIELHEAMKQLGRWYDVEVVYEGKIPSKQFYGSFSRSLTLGETLNILKQARVNFSVQQTGANNRVIVKP